MRELLKRHYVIIALSAGAVRGDRHGPLLIVPLLFISSHDTRNSYENRLFSYNAGIVTPLSISYDECRRPRRGFLCGGSLPNQKKLPARRASKEVLRRRSFVLRMIFMVLI
jgi:hypothetical protein